MGFLDKSLLVPSWQADLPLNINHATILGTSFVDVAANIICVFGLQLVGSGMFQVIDLSRYHAFSVVSHATPPLEAPNCRPLSWAPNYILEMATGSVFIGCALRRTLDAFLSRQDSAGLCIITLHSFQSCPFSAPCRHVTRIQQLSSNSRPLPPQ